MSLLSNTTTGALLAKLCVIVIAMFGFGYALVPFYEKICEATGLRNLAQADVVKNTQVDATRAVRIEFDSNIRKLPWKFRALSPVIDVHPGELTQVVFEIANATDRAADRPGDSELRPAERRAILPQARVLLLFEADAATRRTAADARRVRRRRIAAGGCRERSPCRTLFSRSKVPTNPDRTVERPLPAFAGSNGGYPR